jgi:cytoskeletal protein CcmA (bactofilin family)|tara:strand:+ start:645 stop:1181 length:537 start_codon:yes stop_codon:yes gene_type:complete
VFEKIISKNTESETSRTPPAPHIDSPPAPTADRAKPVAIPAGQRNVLLPDVEIHGEVRFENDLIVDGKIEGKISSKGSLTIGEPAKIKAEIRCGNVIVHGKVQGNITVTDRVEIRARAEVIGDIKAGALVMEAGAIFVGSSTIGTPTQREAKIVGTSPSQKSLPQQQKGTQQAPAPAA